MPLKKGSTLSSPCKPIAQRSPYSSDASKRKGSRPPLSHIADASSFTRRIVDAPAKARSFDWLEHTVRLRALQTEPPWSRAARPNPGPRDLTPNPGPPTRRDGRQTTPPTAKEPALLLWLPLPDRVTSRQVTGPALERSRSKFGLGGACPKFPFCTPSGSYGTPYVIDP